VLNHTSSGCSRRTVRYHRSPCPIRPKEHRTRCIRCQSPAPSHFISQPPSTSPDSPNLAGGSIKQEATKCHRLERLDFLLPLFLIMSSWLRRLSRDRSSKDDRDLPMPSRPFSETPNNNGTHHQSPPFKDTQYSSGFNSQDRLQSYRPSTAGDQGYNATPRGPPVTSGDVSHRPMTSAMEPTPDPLVKAFNEAIRPFQDQIEDLKNKLEDAQYQLGQLQDEREDMHAWIDKRGLRAGSSHLIPHPQFLKTSLTSRPPQTSPLPSSKP